MPESESETKLSTGEQLGTTKSKRQLAVDLSGIAGLGGLWWSMTESPSPDYVLSFAVFLLFLACCLAFLDDYWKTPHQKRKRIIMVLIAAVFTLCVGA